MVKIVLILQKMSKRSSVQAKHTISEYDKAGDRKDVISHPPSGPQKVGICNFELALCSIGLFRKPVRMCNMQYNSTVQFHGS